MAKKLPHAPSPEPQSTRPPEARDVSPKSTGVPVPEPRPAPETPEQARSRAQRCHEAIAAVCAEHHCRVVAMLRDPEPVGRDGSTVQLQAAYAIVPDPIP